MFYSVDEIDKTIVKLIVCNDETIIEINKNLLPSKIKEGTILKYSNGKYIVDNNETRIKKEIINNKFNKLKR